MNAARALLIAMMSLIFKKEITIYFYVVDVEMNSAFGISEVRDHDYWRR
jgi:hypothetical protein